MNVLYISFKQPPPPNENSVYTVHPGQYNKIGIFLARGSVFNNNGDSSNMLNVDVIWLCNF